MDQSALCGNIDRIFYWTNSFISSTLRARRVEKAVLSMAE
jgi:hypothetical protein